MWDALGRRITARLHYPENTQQLKQMLIEEWALLPQEMLHQLVLSMRRRCEATIAVLDESRSFFRVHTGYFSNIPKCIKAEFIASWGCSQSSVVSSSQPWVRTPEKAWMQSSSPKSSRETDRKVQRWEAPDHSQFYREIGVELSRIVLSPV
ncbi:transposable element Tcb2 transposase [Trichonephila clavipes]|uniref:Transposable element Tcb2 transposase n=1 Tax=Trichonephila clavipes TaxID=2585209 RepID=A0A8X6SD55_TRICX|nr:transposable element Tcb2 transposase [Trichonephila clavipes]